MLVKKRNFVTDPDTVQAIMRRGAEVIKVESEAVSSLTSRIDNAFVQACQTLLMCEGRVVVSGMGKSGHIGSKIAATLASTGTPAFFMHPAEASHGDLGMIAPKDVVLAFSYSGETHELLTILPLVKRLGVPLITITGSENSTLARMADIHLNVSVDNEACPLGLAPTASTTASLAMGDAIAVALLEARGFTADDFAKSHPGGSLGKRLLLKIKDIMRTGDALPVVSSDASLSDALYEMTKKCLGLTTIIEAGTTDKIIGVFTDGDLRRTLDVPIDIHQTPIVSVMSLQFKKIGPEALAEEAIRMMEQYQINAIPVTNENQQLIGALNMHDLLSSGVM